jgi:hypothetical protein
MYLSLLIPLNRSSFAEQALPPALSKGAHIHAE